MTDEAEAAAQLRMKESHRQQVAHLETIKNEMHQLGKEWAEFAYVLRNPKGHVFDVGSTLIRIGKPDGNLGKPPAQLRPTDVNWDDFSRLLNDFQDTIKEIQRLEAGLNRQGFNVGISDF
jgi:hypothetical protein